MKSLVSADLQDTCPCCGYATFDGRDEDEICRICWWHDDARDNEKANEPSLFNDYSLNQGRFNFIKYGISCPEREDLKEKQESTSGYARKRFFHLVGGNRIEEWDKNRQTIYRSDRKVSAPARREYDYEY